MSFSNFSSESPENYDQKCCCALVLDVSTSMEGEAIKELNEGLQTFYREIQTDSVTANKLEVAVVEFCDTVSTLVNPSLIGNFSMPTLNVKGSTKLVDGVREGINIVKARKNWYKETGQPYYRPWVILITDGEPDKGQDIAALGREVRDGMSNKEFFFLAIGVQKADMHMLASISDASMAPLKLKGLKFSEFFKWLSASMTTVTHSKEGDKVNLPNPASWMQGFSI